MRLLKFIPFAFVIFISDILHPEPSLLWKYRADSLIISTSPIKDGEITKGKPPENFPLDYILTLKKIEFFNKMGKVEKEYKLKENEYAFISENGNGIAIIDPQQITLLDRNFHPQAKIKTSNVSPYFSPDGNYLVLISNQKKEIQFYDKKGKLLTNIHLEDLQGIQGLFSKNSKCFLISLSNGKISLFTTRGRNLWKFNYPEVAGKVAISSDAREIVLATERNIYLLNRKGKPLWQKMLIPGGIDIAISENGKYLVITRKEDHSVSVYETKDGNLLWKYNIQGLDRINSPFTSLDISRNGDYLIVTASKSWSRQNKECFLYLFNKEGKLIWEKDFNERRIEAKLSPKGENLLVKGDKNIWLYE